MPPLPASDIKARQLPRGVKVRLDATMRVESLRPLRFFDQDCACFGTNQGDFGEELPFFNREVEEGFLLELRNQFVILDGPAGYGKSYLLAQIEQKYKNDEQFHGKWLVVTICLRASQTDDQRVWLLKTLAKQLDLKLEVNSDRKDFTPLEIANQIKRQGKALLILLDGLDQSSDTELIWLRYRFPYQLRSVLGTDVRVILSGRHISQHIEALGNISGRVRQQERALSFSTCSLSAFDRGVVRVIVDWYARSTDIPKPADEFIDRWVEEICFLSGGHPEAIIKLVDDLVHKSDWGWMLQDRRFIPDFIRQELFQRCLKTVSDSILSRTLEDVKGFILNGPSSPPVTKEVLYDLEILALLRRFEMSLLTPLHRLGLLSTDPLLLQGLLVGKGLSGDMDPKTGWRENDGIPRIIALKQRYERETQERCLEVHRTLHTVFHYRAMGYDVEGNPLPRGDLWINATNILLSIFESLYHLLSSTEREPQSQDLADRKEAYLNSIMIQYLSTLTPYCANGRNALKRISGMLNDSSQEEVRFLGRWLLGDDIWSRVYDALRNHLTQPKPSDPTETVTSTRTKLLATEKGEYIMNHHRNLLDSLVDTLDFLRHNARNVLIERWEKRNQGQASTPPAFDNKSRTWEELRSLLPSEDKILIKLKGYRNPNDVPVVVSETHIKNLFEQMKTAQKTVDRYDLQLNKALSVTERIAVEQQRDETQERLRQAEEELADILVVLLNP